jgi:WD40 repeat protein
MMLLVLMSSLVASCGPNSPTATDEPSLAATDTLPAPEVVVTEPIPTAEPTQPVEPAPLDKAALLASLQDHPVITADNLQDLQFLDQVNLGEDDMTLETWAWSPDGRRLALCYSNETSLFGIYDLEDGGRKTSIEVPADVCIGSKSAIENRFTLSRDGEMLAAPMEQGFGIYQTVTGELVSELDLEYSNFLEQVAFSSQGTRLAVSFDYSPVVIRLFEVETGASFGVFFQRYHWYINDLEYSTEGEYLVVASTHGVEAWHVEGEHLPLLDCYIAEVNFSPVQDEAALNCHPTVENAPWEPLIWDLTTGDASPLEGGPNDRILDLKYTPDGTLVAGITESGTVFIWDVDSGQLLSALEISIENPVDLAFVHGGRALAVLNEFGLVGFYTVP